MILLVGTMEVRGRLLMRSQWSGSAVLLGGWQVCVCVCVSGMCMNGLCTVRVSGLYPGRTSTPY